jgi:hypothetical protein
MHRLARAAGLRILRERYLFQWMVPVKLAVRALEALHPAPPAPPRIPPQPLNRLLTAVTRMESEIALRIPFPLGNSLLVSGVAAHPPTGSAG